MEDLLYCTSGDIIATEFVKLWQSVSEVIKTVELVDRVVCDGDGHGQCYIEWWEVIQAVGSSHELKNK